jgi:ASC-1-like (ASCH) protein
MLMSRTLEKKILPEYFDAIASGKKTFELRLGDFDAKEGDTLRLREWDAEKGEYTGREITKEVTYARTFKIDQLYWPEEEIRAKGLTVVSIK